MVPTTLTDAINEKPFLKEVSAAYIKEGFEIYLVGGAVRDGILGIKTTDFDFATNASTEESLTILNKKGYKTTEIGKAYGTVETNIEKCSIHITTYREDTYTTESRKPEIKNTKSLETDLSRRDFTLNSIAYDITKNEIIDPYEGLKDLSKGKIKTPSSPEISFSDDPLRMVRACRFISTHSFTPSTEVFDAISNNLERITIVSKERLRDELTKLLTGKNPSLGIRALLESGLSKLIMPELNELKMEVDPNHHHKDVYEHTLVVLDRVSPTLVSRMSALLHDIGKPKTKGIENGKVHFRHHEVVGAKMTKKIMKGLKYDKDTTNKVALLVENHLRPHTFKMGWTDSAVRRYIIDSDGLTDELNELVRADITTKNKEKEAEINKYLDEMEKRIEEVKEKEELSKLRPPITGNEIMDMFELEPGPIVGKIMDALYEQRINDGEVSKEEAIKLAKETYKKL